jgi:hypothetical protein
MSEYEYEYESENEVANTAAVADPAPTDELEANESDIFEQLLDAEGKEDTVKPVPAVPESIEVDPADAAEQLLVVPLDEDDYR